MKVKYQEGLDGTFTQTKFKIDVLLVEPIRTLKKNIGESGELWDVGNREKLKFRHVLTCLKDCNFHHKLIIELAYFYIQYY